MVGGSNTGLMTVYWMDLDYLNRSLKETGSNPWMASGLRLAYFVFRNTIIDVKDSKVYLCIY